MPGARTAARRRCCSSGPNSIRSRRARALTWRESRQPSRESKRGMGGGHMIKRRNIFTRLRHLIVAVAAAALPSTLRTAEAKETGAMERKAMSDLFDKHVNAELAGDLDSTMATMSDNPWLTHVPTRAG